MIKRLIQNNWTVECICSQMWNGDHHDQCNFLRLMFYFEIDAICLFAFFSEIDKFSKFSFKYCSSCFGHLLVFIRIGPSVMNTFIPLIYGDGLCWWGVLLLRCIFFLSFILRCFIHGASRSAYPKQRNDSLFTEFNRLHASPNFFT